MLGRLGRVFDPNEREVKQHLQLAREIGELEPGLQVLDDEALAARSLALRERAEGGEDLDDLLVEAFALCREAAKRTNIELLHVSARQRLNLPGDDPQTNAPRFYFPNKRGTERINAILFRSKDRAMALLEAFPASGKLDTLAAAQDREVRIGTGAAPTAGKPFYTSDVIFETIAP